MFMRKDGKNCNACFMRGCDCECDTCRAVRDRNMSLTSRELDIMNAKDAGATDEIVEKVYGKTSKSPS